MKSSEHRGKTFFFLLFLDYFFVPAHTNLPIPDEQLGVSRRRNRDGADGDGLSEPGAELGDDQLLHGARDGGAFKIQEVSRVGRVDDGAPRPDSRKTPAREQEEEEAGRRRQAGHDGKVQLGSRAPTVSSITGRSLRTCGAGRGSG